MRRAWVARLGAGTLLGLAFLMLGAALAVAFTLLAVVVVSGFLGSNALPLWATVTAGVVTGASLVVVVGAIPAVRRIEGVAAESMLSVAFDGGPPTAAVYWQDRWRSVAWLWAHLLAGAALVIMAATVPVLAQDVATWLVLPAALLLLVVGGLFVVGLRRLAPVLLGPSLSERVAKLEREATDLGERHRIAREIHDSVGHAVSLVTVQAAAARRVQSSNPQFVAEALAAIEDAARRAAGELDHVLGLLRVDVEAPRRPSPDLADLPDLVDVARRAGLDVTLEDRAGDTGVVVPPVVSRELYRVAQEALSNVLRHGSGPCRVSLDRAAGAVTLEVTNAAGPERGSGSRRGHGLRGIRERAAAIGGSATAGPVDGGWRLRVVLPGGSAR